MLLATGGAKDEPFACWHELMNRHPKGQAAEQGLESPRSRAGGTGSWWPFFLGTLALAAALHWDDALWELRGGQSSGARHVAAQWISASANGGVLIPVAAAVVGWLAWRGPRPAARWFLAMTLAGSIAGLSGTLLRSAIGRARPLSPVNQGWHGPRVDGHWVIGRHAYGAFPSGHTSLAAGFGAFWFLHRRRSGLIGLGYAAAVAWSRVELGAHRPSDVMAGLLVGPAVALLVGPPLLARARGWLPDKPVDGDAPTVPT